MVKIETIRYENRTIRLILLDGRWWVPAQDAVPFFDTPMSADMLFANAPQDERRFDHFTGGIPSDLLSARYLIRRLSRSQKSRQSYFRAWLKAWKVVTGTADYSGVE
jgi:prophage antirepressor-like protein